VQIGHGRGDGALVGGLHHFVGEVVGQCPQQRHAFRRGESQIEPVHTALRKAASGLAVGGDALIEPARRYARIRRTSISGAPIQADQLHGATCVAGNQPCRRPGIAFGVVLPQPPVGPPPIDVGVRSLAGGVVVIVDAPTR
jgi:hypothetical protein